MYRKISRGFQITLPPEFRERHGLKIGDVIEMRDEGHSLSVHPALQTSSQNMATKLIELLKQSPADGVTEIPEERLLNVLGNEIETS